MDCQRRTPVRRHPAVLLPVQYFTGAFTHDSFLRAGDLDVVRGGDVVGAGDWHDRPGLLNASIARRIPRPIFLSWPIWLGPSRAGVLGSCCEPICRSVSAVYLAIVLTVSRHRGAAIPGSMGWMVIVRPAAPCCIHRSRASDAAAATGGERRACGPSRASTRISVALLLVTALQMRLVLVPSASAHTPYMRSRGCISRSHPMRYWRRSA